MEPDDWGINVHWAYLLWALWFCAMKLVNSSLLSGGNTTKFVSLLLFYLQFIVWKLFSSNIRYCSSLWEPRKALWRAWVWEHFQVSYKMTWRSTNHMKSSLLSLLTPRTCHQIGQQTSRATSNRFSIQQKDNGVWGTRTLVALWKGFNDSFHIWSIVSITLLVPIYMLRNWRSEKWDNLLWHWSQHCVQFRC